MITRDTTHKSWKGRKDTKKVSILRNTIRKRENQEKGRYLADAALQKQVLCKVVRNGGERMGKREKAREQRNKMGARRVMLSTERKKMAKTLRYTLLVLESANVKCLRRAHC